MKFQFLYFSVDVALHINTLPTVLVYILLEYHYKKSKYTRNTSKQQQNSL